MQTDSNIKTQMNHIQKRQTKTEARSKDYTLQFRICVRSKYPVCHKSNENYNINIKKLYTKSKIIIKCAVKT